MIEIKNVIVGYSNKALLSMDDVQLDLGQLYILIGKNGSGKSTLLKSIVGLEKVIDGSILLNTKNISTFSKQDTSKMIAFVRSTFPNTDYLKVYDYIALGRSPYTNAFGRLSNTDLDIIKSAIKTLNIEHLSEKFTTELSDGERQLVSIAKALCQDTSIILLDEPTAFLDYSNKTLLHTTLKRIALETKKCIILSSHDLELSLETKSDFLTVNSKSKKLELIKAPSDRQTLISIAFS